MHEDAPVDLQACRQRGKALQQSAKAGNAPVQGHGLGISRRSPARAEPQGTKRLMQLWGVPQGSSRLMQSSEPRGSSRLMQSKGVPQGSSRLIQSGSRGEPAAVQQTSREKVRGMPIQGEPVEVAGCAESDRAGIVALGHPSSKGRIHEYTLVVPDRVAPEDRGALARVGRDRYCTRAGKRQFAPGADLAPVGEPHADFAHVPRHRRGTCACLPVQPRGTAFPCAQRGFRCAANRETR